MKYLKLFESFDIDENNIAYLCIVGKRGGHSWQKII